MAVAKEATARIQNQDLDFTIQHSGITEIDEMLFSLEQMRTALKESLEKQWKMEQNRREQILSLAHDIKMPLTVIHGNTDLLGEMHQTAEQFYMDDQSRTSKAHYGISLYFASSVSEQHGGGLMLENSPETGGGMATIYFSI